MRIVCIGAGYTSLLGSAAIKKHLPDASVILINRTSTHIYPHHLPALIRGAVTAEDIQINLVRYSLNAHVTFIEGHVHGVERSEQVVLVGEERIPYDILLLDLTSEPVIPVPGAADAIRIGGAASALALRQHMIAQLRRARESKEPKYRTAIAVGNGARGVEIISAMHDLTRTLCKEHCIFPEELDYILTGTSHQDDALPEHTRKRTQEMLEDNGIEWYSDAVRAFDENGIVLPDRELEASTIVWTGDKRGHALMTKIGIDVDLRGRALVNNFLQTSDSKIFAAGSSAALRGHEIWKHSFNAEHEREIVVKNIVALANHQRMTAFIPSDAARIIDMGGKRALYVGKHINWYGRFPAWLRSQQLRAYDRKV